MFCEITVVVDAVVFHSVFLMLLICDGKGIRPVKKSRIGNFQRFLGDFGDLLTYLLTSPTWSNFHNIDQINISKSFVFR